MSCAAVATSPALAACHSPSPRPCDDPLLFGEVRSASQLATCLDLLPSPPLLYTTPKLFPFASSCKPSPSNSAMPPPPSPRVQCSPRTSSWTSPIRAPSARTVCSSGGFPICSPCSCPSCNRISASPIDSVRRSSSLEKRFNADAYLEGKHGSCVEPPSPRLSSPGLRFSRAMSLIHSSPIEAPSPRYGGTHSAFTSPTFYSRPGLSNVKLQACVVDEYENFSASENSAFPGESWISNSEDLFRLDIPEDQENLTLEPLSSSNGRDGFSADVAGLSARPGTPPLKRKRPPRLEIPPGVNPIIPNNGLHVLDLVEDALNEMIVEGSYYGVSCKKGRRETLEDTQRAVPDLQGDPGQAFFGVFDGHGGRKAADFAAEKLVDKIMDAMERPNECEGDHMVAAVRTGYLTTDAEFLQKRIGSGASCVTAIMKDGYMVVANAGDCRAVLSRAGYAEALTSDHRAGRDDERRRIEDLGGFVDDSTGTWRVQGSLAVSRGIGDIHLKEWISAEPEIQKLRITHDCEFLILASDGLWDLVTNQEAVDIARGLLQSERVKAEVMDLQIPMAMASSSLSKGLDDRLANIGNLQGREYVNTIHDHEDEESVPNRADIRVSPLDGDGDLDICEGSIDAEEPSVGFPEPPLPSAGPVAACRRLVEVSVNRGCHDDISVMIVDLQHFQRKL